MHNSFDYNNSYQQYNNGFPYINNNFYQNDKLKSEIKNHGTLVGICIIIYFVMQLVLGLVLRVFKLQTLYLENYAFSQIISIFYSILFLFIPFFIISRKIEKRTHLGNIGFDKPVNKKIFLLSIPTGLMLCYLGDYISLFIQNFFANFGITLSAAAEEKIPTNIYDTVLFFLAIVFIPCFVEEFTMRGVTMQPLRKYGDGFAIISTAIVFGLIHMNIVQGIFAFIAGTIFGYISIISGSVWSAVIVHALNNLLYGIINLLTEKNETLGNTFYSLSTMIIMIVGAVCIVLLSFDKDRIHLKKNSLLTTKEKFVSFFGAVPMLISIIFMVAFSVFK